MTSPENWNQRVIDEFRANGGHVGGPFEGAPMLLLTTTGAKSGRQHTTPLMYQPGGEREYFVFASANGAPTHPAWYHNLTANPTVRLEVGNESFDAKATVLTDEERERVYQKQVEIAPQFGEYQQKTTRQIPVIRLQRAS